MRYQFHAKPLRRETKKGVEFEWGPEQAEAFQKLKKELTRVEILGYYDKGAVSQNRVSLEFWKATERVPFDQIRPAKIPKI